MSRTASWTSLLWLACGCWLGCTGPAIRSQSPENEPADQSETKLVGDYARAYGLTYVKVEGVCLVSGLHGTGSDPPPSSQRAMLLSEMQHRKVPHPSQVLASPDTAMVLVRGFLRPGIQKGDHFDVDIRVPARSETKSLRGGYLLETRMTELAVLGNQIHKGHLMALAEGPVLVEPAADGPNKRLHQTRGRVLGGGVALKSRVMGLIVHEEHRSVRVTQQIGEAVNKRFHTYVRGVKQGVATPKTDDFIELIVHPRYQDNVARYMRVVRNIAYRETIGQRDARMQLLKRQLDDPITSQAAALRLEAIGKDAIDILKQGMEAQAPEVRFFAAEALAYLDVVDAAEVLGKVARDEPAFRVHALAALSTMDNIVAYEQLRQLLSVPSAETRYGAFRALWEMNPGDGLVRGETLGGQFSYHLLPDVGGPPMIHVTRSHRPEIVVFGPPPKFTLPMVLEAGQHILVNGLSGGEVTVSRFEVGKPDQKRFVGAGVDEVIRAIVELGGTYPDVVQALQQAEDNGALEARLEVDALPESGRVYHRDSIPEDTEALESGA
jgi:flagellar basal body P-ring protein FlgI